MERISECSVGEVRVLTPCFQVMPNVDPLDYVSETFTAIESLPSRLKRPGPISKRFKSYAKPRKPLCAMHKLIHPKIVHSVFSLIALEVGVHLNRLVQDSELLTAAQTARVQRLRQLHLKWLSPTQYEETFGGRLIGDEQWKFQLNECEGCMIAQFASHLPTLLDLRAAVHSRLSRHQIKHRGEPRLMLWLDQWFENYRGSFPPDVFQRALTQNNDEALELKDTRKKISEAKHGGKHRKRATSKLPPIQEDETESLNSPYPPMSGAREDVEETARDEPYDSVIDIVDHYGELRRDLGFSSRPASLQRSVKSYGSNHPSERVRSPSPCRSGASVKSDMPSGRVRQSFSSQRSMQSTAEDDYVSPRANWKKTDRAGSSASYSLSRERLSDYERFLRDSAKAAQDSTIGRKPSVSSEDHARAYRDLLSPRLTEKFSTKNGSVWDDASLRNSTIMYFDWNKSRNVADKIFNSEAAKQKSEQGEEWIALPDAFKEEMEAADRKSDGSRTSRAPTVKGGSSIRTNSPPQIGRASTMLYPDVFLPSDRNRSTSNKPESVRGRASTYLAPSSYGQDRSISRAHSSNDSSARSRAPSIASTSSRYSTMSTYSMNRKDMPQSRMSLRPDDHNSSRPRAGAPKPEASSRMSTDTRWSNVYGGDSRRGHSEDRNDSPRRFNSNKY